MTTEIDGNTYKIRLMTGGSSQGNANDGSSEWNDLIWGLGTELFDDWDTDKKDSNEADDFFGTGSGDDGRASWTQEQGSCFNSRLFRGYYGVSSFVRHFHSHFTNSIFGWRPVLELVGEAPLSDNADLGSLEVTDGTLTPDFDPNHTEYTVVADEGATVTIERTFAHEGATCIEEGDVHFGLLDIIIWPEDLPYTHTDVIMAEDGETTKTYTVRVEGGGVPEGNLENSPIDLGNSNQYLGIVSDLMTIGELEEATGIDDNTAYGGQRMSHVENSDDQIPFLKFEKNDGTILFVAQKTVRNYIAWDAINGGTNEQNTSSDPTNGNVNSAVYGAMRTEIDGNTYKIRLLTGADGNPADGETQSSASDHSNGIAGPHEWNDLIVKLHDGNTYDDDFFELGNWGNGHASWTQEEHGSISFDRVIRGGGGVSNFTINRYSYDTYSFIGWRPALELVSND